MRWLTHSSRCHGGPALPARTCGRSIRSCRSTRVERETTGRSIVGLAEIAWKTSCTPMKLRSPSLTSHVWLTIRYEDFAREPLEGFEKILRFAGLEWNRVFERGLARYHFRADRLNAFDAELGRKTLLC